MIVVTCRKLTELATKRQEGDLPLLDRAGVRIHLAWCTRCRNYLAQLDLTVATVAATPAEPVSEDVHAQLMAQFRRRRTQQTE